MDLIEEVKRSKNSKLVKALGGGVFVVSLIAIGLIAGGKNLEKFHRTYNTLQGDVQFDPEKWMETMRQLSDPQSTLSLQLNKNYEQQLRRNYEQQLQINSHKSTYLEFMDPKSEVSQQFIKSQPSLANYDSTTTSSRQIGEYLAERRAQGYDYPTREELYSNPERLQDHPTSSTRTQERDVNPEDEY